MSRKQSHLGRDSPASLTSGDARIPLPENPFVPPHSDVCYIHRLPNELLSLIFVSRLQSEVYKEIEVGLEDEHHAEAWDKRNQVQEEREDAEADGSTSFPSPVLVSQVSKHWRDVALATPALWTNVVVSPSMRWPFTRVRAWLERSANLPLNISIRCDDDRDYEPSHGSGSESSSDDDSDSSSSAAPSDPSMPRAHFDELLLMLLPHIPRWRVLELGVYDYEFMRVFLTRLSTTSVPSADRLHILSLRSFDALFNGAAAILPDDVQYKLFNNGAPELRCLELSGVHISWNQPYFLGSVNLVELSLSYQAPILAPSWQTFSHMLRASPTLEKLVLCMSGPSAELQPWDDAVIELPALKELQLLDLSAAYDTSLFRRLAMPSLKTLSLNISDLCSKELVDVLVAPGQSPAHAPASHGKASVLAGIEHLSLPMFTSRIEEAARVLESLTNVKTLEVIESRRRSSIIPLLYSLGPVYLPHLSRLVTRGITGANLRMLVSRRAEGGAALRVLGIRDMRLLGGPDVQWLRDHVDSVEYLW